VYYLQDGIVGFIRTLFARKVAKAVQVRTGATDKDAVMAAANTTVPVGADLLVGEGILMQFGPEAINQVDIRIKRGTIHG
jgi:branched-chain amino acid transport system permease protein